MLFLLSISSMFAQTNLASSATATALSGTAADAIDGNDGTRWESTHGVDPQWIQLELDAVYSIDNIKIHWEGANAKAYTIEISTDNSTWTTVHTETNGASADRWDDVKFTAASAKYIKITGTERNLTYGYSIWEIEVYEPISDASNATLSDIKVDGTTIDGFEAGVKEYTYLVSSSSVPTTTATPTITGANVVITEAQSIPGTTNIVVTSIDNTDTISYSVLYKKALNLPLDFEAESGPYSWAGFGGAAMTVVANPQSSGINTSAQVAQMVKQGETWAGSWIAMDGLIDFSGEKVITMKVYAPRVGAKVLLKIENMTNGAIAHEVEMATTVANQWETMEFDFSAINTANEYQKVVIICDNGTVGDGTADYTYLIDDIAFKTADPAKDATLSDLKVGGITIDNFESSTTEYTYVVEDGNVPTVTYTTTQSAATTVVTAANSVPGTTTVKVTSSDASTDMTYSINFVDQLVSEYCARYVANNDHSPAAGSGLWPAYLTISNIDATSFYVQMDPVAGDTIDLLLVQSLPEGFSETSSETIDEVSMKKVFTSSSTVPDSLTIQILWSLSGEAGNAMLSTFKVPFSAQCAGDVTPEPTAPTEAPATPSANETDVICIYSDSYTNIAGLNTYPGWGQGTVMSEVDFSSNMVFKYANLDYQGITFDVTDMSSMEYLHLDYWTYDATAFKFSVITSGVANPDGDAALENAYDLVADENFTKGQWVSIDIPLSEYSVPNLSYIDQLKTEGNGTIYLDNIYFWKKNSTGLQNDLASKLQVISHSGALRITTSTPTNIYVYSISGQQVFNGQCENELNVELQKGLYIVKADDFTTKCVVR